MVIVIMCQPLDEVCTHYNIPAYLHPLDQELLQLIRRRPSVYKKKCIHIVMI